MNYKVVVKCVLIFLSLFSCLRNPNLDMEGVWLSISRNSLIERIIIHNDSVILIDDFEFCYLGKPDLERGKLLFTINEKKLSPALDYRIIKEDSIHIDGYPLIKVKETVENCQTDFELLGFDTELIYPFSNSHKIGNTYVKIRSSSSDFPYLMERTKGELKDIPSYYTSIINSTSGPKRRAVGEVLIFIEKGMLLKDLILFQQAYTLENYSSKFILITNYSGVAKYKCVIDDKCQFVDDRDDLQEIFNLESKTNNPPYPPLPPSSLGINNIQDYKDKNAGIVIEINDLIDYKIQEKEFNVDSEIILRLSSQMSILDYLSILDDIQKREMSGQTNIKVHILSLN